MTTVVEDDPKAPFSITTTPRCRGRALLLSLDCSTLPGFLHFPWIAPLYHFTEKKNSELWPVYKVRIKGKPYKQVIIQSFSSTTLVSILRLKSPECIYPTPFPMNRMQHKVNSWVLIKATSCTIFESLIWLDLDWTPVYRTFGEHK